MVVKLASLPEDGYESGVENRSPHIMRYFRKITCKYASLRSAWAPISRGVDAGPYGTRNGSKITATAVLMFRGCSVLVPGNVLLNVYANGAKITTFGLYFLSFYCLFIAFIVAYMNAFTGTLIYVHTNVHMNVKKNIHKNIQTNGAKLQHIRLR